MPEKRRAELSLGQFVPEMAQAVNRTGKTLRFRGRVDIEAAKLFFGQLPAAAEALKFLNFTDASRLYPLGMIPITAHFLKSKSEIRIRCDNNPSINEVLLRNGYFDFLTDGTQERASNYKHRVLQFMREEQSYEYSKQVFEDIVGKMRCGRDVVQAFTWAVDELVGNVFHHSESAIGALAQTLLFPQTRKLQFTLVDAGAGILSKMKLKFSKLELHKEAIELAIQRGVTSKKENQGWGLFGSTQIVTATRGTMTIWSGDSCLRIENGSLPFYESVPYFGGTIVQCELRSDVDIRIQDVLQSKHEPISYEVWKYKAENGMGRLRLQYEAVSFGSRKVGKSLRNKLLNAITNSATHSCVVDFANVEIVSSSFADEFLGKAAVLLGVERFRKNVYLQNLPERTAAILNIAINERLRTGL